MHTYHTYLTYRPILPFLPYLPHGTERANIHMTMQTGSHVRTQLKTKAMAQVVREVVHYACLPYLQYLPYGTQRANIHNPMQAVCMLGVMRPCSLIGVHYAYLLTYLWESVMRTSW